MKNSMFSSNRPVFTTKVNLQADYAHEATDGLDSLQPKEVVLNGAELAAIKKQINSDESDKEGELKKCIEQKISGAQGRSGGGEGRLHSAEDAQPPLGAAAAQQRLPERLRLRISGGERAVGRSSAGAVGGRGAGGSERCVSGLERRGGEVGAAPGEPRAVGARRVRCAGAGHHPRCKKRTAVMRSGTGGAVRGGVVRARDAAAGDGAERAARGLRGGGRGARR